MPAVGSAAVLAVAAGGCPMAGDATASKVFSVFVGVVSGVGASTEPHGVPSKGCEEGLDCICTSKSGAVWTSMFCVIDSEMTGMCSSRLCGCMWHLENLQSRQAVMLLPYAWLYETLDDEHSSWQAYDGISLVTNVSESLG